MHSQFRRERGDFSLDLNESQKEVCARTRGLIQELLKNGAQPSDISFVLSFLATELGLAVTEGSVSVVPVVFAGISNAINNAIEGAPDEEDVEEERPQWATVH